MIEGYKQEATAQLERHLKAAKPTKRIGDEELDEEEVDLALKQYENEIPHFHLYFDPKVSQLQLAVIEIKRLLYDELRLSRVASKPGPSISISDSFKASETPASERESFNPDIGDSSLDLEKLMDKLSDYHQLQ